jgi:hypothetical protein
MKKAHVEQMVFLQKTKNLNKCWCITKLLIVCDYNYYLQCIFQLLPAFPLTDSIMTAKSTTYSFPRSQVTSIAFGSLTGLRLFLVFPHVFQIKKCNTKRYLMIWAIIWQPRRQSALVSFPPNSLDGRGFLRCQSLVGRCVRAPRPRPAAPRGTAAPGWQRSGDEKKKKGLLKSSHELAADVGVGGGVGQPYSSFVAAGSDSEWTRRLAEKGSQWNE